MNERKVIQLPIPEKDSDTLIIFDNNDTPNSVSHTDCNTSFVVDGLDVMIGTKPENDGFMEVHDKIHKDAFIDMCFQFILLNDPYKLDGHSFEKEDLDRSN